MNGKAIKLKSVKEPVLVVEDSGLMLWHRAIEEILDNDIVWQDCDARLRFLLRLLYQQANEIAQLTGEKVLLSREIRIENDPDDPLLLFTVINRNCD